MRYLAGAYVVADSELWILDGKVRQLKSAWHWVGMGVIRAHTAEAYIVIDEHGNLEEA